MKSHHNRPFQKLIVMLIMVMIQLKMNRIAAFICTNDLQVNVCLTLSPPLTEFSSFPCFHCRMVGCTIRHLLKENWIKVWIKTRLAETHLGVDKSEARRAEDWCIALKFFFEDWLLRSQNITTTLGRLRTVKFRYWEYSKFGCCEELGFLTKGLYRYINGRERMWKKWKGRKKKHPALASQKVKEVKRKRKE